MTTTTPREQRIARLYHLHLSSTKDTKDFALRAAQDEVRDGALPAYFWTNVSTSRRRRLRRRAIRRGLTLGVITGVGTFLVVHGILSSDLTAITWGGVIVAGALSALLILTSPRRQP